MLSADDPDLRGTCIKFNVRGQEFGFIRPSWAPRDSQDPRWNLFFHHSNVLNLDVLQDAWDGKMGDGPLVLFNRKMGRNGDMNAVNVRCILPEVFMQNIPFRLQHRDILANFIAQWIAIPPKRVHITRNGDAIVTFETEHDARCIIESDMHNYQGIAISYYFPDFTSGET